MGPPREVGTGSSGWQRGLLLLQVVGSLMGSGEEEVEEEGVPGQDEGVDDQQHLISGATNSKKG